MELKVYEKEEKDATIYLKLVCDSGGVLLCAVDESGAELSGGRLLRINLDGTINRIALVNPKLGFQLDGDRVIVDATI